MFALTYRCNLKCKICRAWEEPRYKEELDIDEIEKIFKSLSNLSWLDLTGGELTLRQDLIEIIKLIIINTKRLSLLHISTNGQLPHKIFLLAKEILKFEKTFLINIGIDGPRKINDGLKGREGAYLNSIETFRLIKSLNKGYCYLSCSLSDYNIEYIDMLLSELKKDLPAFSFSDLHFNIFHKSSHYYKNQDVEGLSNFDFGKLKRYLLLSKNGNPIKKFLADRYIKGVFRYFKENKFPLRCQALRSSCFINSYGEVYPCVIYDRQIGDLREYDYNLNKLWSSSSALKIRNDIENQACPGCWTPCEAYPAILGDLFFK
jgi:MoaA/NifB/PqqE/SkfB family radical SAM enzyme